MQTGALEKITFYNKFSDNVTATLNATSVHVVAKGCFIF
jgi:hypothetical protein